jgi:hypothetical protein
MIIEFLPDTAVQVHTTLQSDPRYELRWTVLKTTHAHMHGTSSCGPYFVRLRIQKIVMPHYALELTY